MNYEKLFALISNSFSAIDRNSAYESFLQNKTNFNHFNGREVSCHLLDMQAELEACPYIHNESSGQMALVEREIF